MSPAGTYQGAKLKQSTLEENPDAQPDESMTEKETQKQKSKYDLQCIPLS